ncbi:MAG: hypothetical protein KKG00_13025, partial [Bacteroidetes bacterium]|nr:hypothetical protein [Bacteroidota bacterium]
SIMLENFPNKIPPHHQDLIFFKEKFRSKGSYGELRDKIMHPVKPILSDQKTIFQIDELLTDYPIILEIVNRKVN